MPHVELELPEPGVPYQLEGQPDDLDVGIETALSQQLGAGLERFFRAVAPFRLLPKYSTRIAESQGIRDLSERGRGYARDARREVVAQGEHPTVAIDEPNEPLGDLGSAGAEEDVFVFENGRDELFVARRSEDFEGRTLKTATAGCGGTASIQGAGWNRRLGHVVVAPAPRRYLTVFTRRPSISTISKTSSPTEIRSPFRGRRPS